MPSVLFLNGPNLNLLGQREPEIYGSDTLGDIERRLCQVAGDYGLSVAFFQTNAEHELIERIHAAFRDATDFIVINPGAFTHTSVALRDALLGTRLPFIEVHLSNVHAREAFRRHSYLSDIARGVITGFGAQGYEFALAAAAREISKSS
ncbi:type II 3-dehydroquinate dehydratase [Methylolobus aquaticus]